MKTFSVMVTSINRVATVQVKINQRFTSRSTVLGDFPIVGIFFLSIKTLGRCLWKTALSYIRKTESSTIISGGVVKRHAFVVLALQQLRRLRNFLTGGRSSVNSITENSSFPELPGSKSCMNLSGGKNTERRRNYYSIKPAPPMLQQGEQHH